MAALTILLVAPIATEAASTKPTIVLVHGAMADSSSWNGVIPLLAKNGYNVVAVADPLRSVAGDAASVASVIKAIDGPVVLVGHSYGGAVITNAASGNNNVISLVYVAAFAPEKGESAFALIGRYPGSELAAALARPVTLSDGGNDLSVDPAKFAGPFAADLPHDQVTLMAITQRPVTEAALRRLQGRPPGKRSPPILSMAPPTRASPRRCMPSWQNGRKRAMSWSCPAHRM
jgi:pimeloyl-ACP methyl ester carboxylesterase